MSTSYFPTGSRFPKLRSRLQKAAGKLEEFHISVGVHQGSARQRYACDKTTFRRPNIWRPTWREHCHPRDGTELPRTNFLKIHGSTSLDHEIVAPVNVVWLKWRLQTGVLCEKQIPDRFMVMIWGYAGSAIPKTFAWLDHQRHRPIQAHGDVDFSHILLYFNIGY